MKRKHLILLLGVFLLVFFVVIGCKQEVEPPGEPPVGQPPATANYVGSDSCEYCHTESHKGFTKTQHYNAFKPLSEYNISDLPNEITIFDTANTESPKSATINLSEAYGVMVDDYVIAPVPATAGFTNEVYRVAAIHKEGDNWTLEPARTGDFNNDGTEDWGGASYTCGSCHSPGLGKSEKEATIGCESCHGPGGNHVQAEDKEGTMTVSQDACLTCHTSNPSKGDDGVWVANNHYGTRDYFASKHANSMQTNNCLACHTPHNVNSEGQTVIGDDPVKDNCIKCHEGANFNLDELMWKNPTDAHSHITRDHSFGAMPYAELGDKEGTKPIEITNPDMIELIEDKIEE